MVNVEQWLNLLITFEAHSLVFFSRYGRIDVFVRGDAEGGFLRQVDSIGFSEFNSMAKTLVSHSEYFGAFETSKRIIALPIHHPLFEQLFSSHITITHQPMSVGQFIFAISRHYTQEAIKELQKNVRTMRAPELTKEQLQGIKDAELAEYNLRKELMNDDCYQLSKKSKAAYHEYELRMEPLNAPGSGYSPFWGWWFF
ncbi:hypothetical protein M6C35_001930 [Vibrio metschnikovii]|nr:hypothetical protein [Vibrio metschnikovii]